ncbi:helix-turn-helix domain-containing protein [Actinospongicola halichondriae]|uniref:helix-turn-helix domain-containing protein n=1 Tax=Actinospongicola halichondriae TaxID=3236844 RepID=UPI003D46C791
MAHHLEPVPPLRSTSRSTRLTLSIAEAAELVGISRTTAYELAQSGELPTVRLGRRILVPVNQLADILGTDVDAVLDALRSRPAS